jgi:hypothetical protein
MAVQRKGSRVVVFSWVRWPDTATRGAAWKRMTGDQELTAEEMPFDGKRMTVRGFDVLVEVLVAAVAGPRQCADDRGAGLRDSRVRHQCEEHRALWHGQRKEKR